MAKPKSSQPLPPPVASHRAKRTRSPNYPALDLPTAIKRVADLHKKEGRHAVPYTVAAAHWGYKPDSSSALQTVAAIKAFGLVDIDGTGDTRAISVSERGLDIVLDEQDQSQARESAIKAAALAPALHRELWQKYGASLPSDATIRTYLQRERGFNQTALDPFITEYKATTSFAKLGESDIIVEEQGDGDDTDSEENGRPAPQTAHRHPRSGLSPMNTGTNQETISFKLEEGPVVLQWPARLSKTSLEDLEDWIKIALRKFKRTTGSDGKDK